MSARDSYGYDPDKYLGLAALYGEADMTEPEHSYAYLLYIGSFLNKEKKISHLYIDVGEDWRKSPRNPHDDDVKDKYGRVYSKLMGGFSRPGGIYKVRCASDGENSVYPSSAILDGTWPIKADIVVWQSKEDMAKAERKAQASAKTWSKRRVNWETLEPIRKAYHRMPHNQQAAFLMAIAKAITGSKILSQKEEDE